MSDRLEIALLPLGEVLRVRKGTPLQDVLFPRGVEFPCGGRGRCKGCKVKVLEGALPISAEEREKLSEAELADGWRLACRGRADGNLKLELAQWDAAILSDDSSFEFTPGSGWGIAIDLGTTTIAAQLLDLKTGRVLAVRTALNAQARHGADIMSRVEFAVGGQGQRALEETVRSQIGKIIQDLVNAASARRAPEALVSIVLVGNTVMHHFFSGISVEPLSHVPFEPLSAGAQRFKASELGWGALGNASVCFLPCLGGFVGSDILAGILATKLHERDSVNALLDLGTNGEMVVGNRERLLCASTAAGPAFEGARISMGMRAATGAISQASLEGGQLRCHVLGGGPPRGVCGSGLVDAVAAALDLGLVLPSGRLAKGDSLELAPPVSLTQKDIRELQLAKGAIAAGLHLLLDQWGAGREQLERVYLAGAFGNYINQASARRLGLLAFPPEKICPAGNTALLGAKLALFNMASTGPDYASLLAKVKHVSLNEDANFQEQFVAAMGF